MSPLRQKQAAVAAWILLGLALTIGGFLLPFAWGDFPRAPSDPLERIALWLAGDLFAVLFLLFAIARLARHRFFSAENIDAGGGGTPHAMALQAQLQNTLEQVVLAIVAHGAWMLLAPAALGMLALLFVGYFCVGRVLFFVGYGRGAPGRALGFALTFYPSAGMILGALPWAAETLAPLALPG